MGNICGKEEKDNFSSPGRPLNSGSSPSTGPKKVSVPKSATQGPGRTLGGGSSAATSAPGGGGDASSAPPDEARRRAAEAAEARAAAKNKPGGKLQNELNNQRRQTMDKTLKEVSAQNARNRDVDDAAKLRNWD